MDMKFVVEQVVGVTFIFAVAGLMGFLLRWQSAASRYMVWFLSMVAALLLPLASLLKPAGVPNMLVAPVRSTFDITVGPDDLGSWSISAQLLFIGWAIGFVLMAARLVWGNWQIHRRHRRAQPSGIRGVPERIAVRLSSAIAVPETFGFLRPVILLPLDSAGWTPDCLRVVLAHEIVHIERHDWLTQIIAQVSLCVYWFHPLAWVAMAEMRKERELACDDGVLRQGYHGSEYAQHLVDIARVVQRGTTVFAPSIAMATRSQLEGRVRAILNPTVNRGRVNTMMKIAATSLTAIAIVLFSSASGDAAGPTTAPGNTMNTSSAAHVQAGNQPKRIRVGGNVQSTKLVRKVQPKYPPQMKEAGITGTVALQAVISREGHVLNLQSISSSDVHPDLVEAAITAVQQWQYEPTLLNGEPVEIETQINVNFTLLP